MNNRFHIWCVDLNVGWVFTYEGPVLEITQFYDKFGHDTDDPTQAISCIAEFGGNYYPIENLAHVRRRVLH